MWILLALAGCVRVPHDEACCLLEPTPSVGSAASDTLFVHADFPDSCWWQLFKDPQLDALIEQALCENPTIQRAQARIRAMEAEAVVKRSYLFPTLEASAQVDWEHLGRNNFFRAFTPVIPANVPQYEPFLNFNYELDLWGKNHNIYKAALGEAKTAIAEKESAILFLTTSVSATYFQLQADLDQLALLEDIRGVYEQSLSLVKMRVENALDTSFQQLDAEKELFIINQSLLYTQAKIALQKHLLKALLGEGPESDSKVDKITLKAIGSFPLPTNISSNLLARRPDLMAQIWRVESAARLVGAAKADFYPRVNLLAVAGLSSVFFSKLFTENSFYARALPAVYLPIFNAGRIRNRLRARRAEFEEMVYQYNETVLRAVKEVADQIVTLQTATATLTTQNQIVANRFANLNLMGKRFENALSNALDVLEQRKVTLQEQLTKVKLTYDQNLAAVLLIKALGGGYCTEEVPFDCP